MSDDPHDLEARLPEFAKDDGVERVLAAMNEALAEADLPRADALHAEALPVVFVVGAPRSGTTLVHQLIARHLALSYIDNIVARFWTRPSVGIALSRSALGAKRTFTLHSRHGVTEEAAGAHEFGYFWRRWLPVDESPTHHLTPALQARVDTVGLRRALREEILAPFGTGVVFKNVICGFHARLLTQVHRRSLFVHVTRDDAAVARSILASRFERYGRYDVWWSLKPSTYPLHGSPVEQVVQQARDCRSEIAAELAHENVHSLELDYGELCADPAASLRAIAAAVDAVAPPFPEPRGDPESLRSSAGPPLPYDVESELRAALDG